MAYWGEAMSLYHQLWDRPSAADLANGRASKRVDWLRRLC